MDKENRLNLDLGEVISALRYFLKRFDTKTRKYKTFFRGKSFDFEGFRDYTPDDDVSMLDWKSSNRAGKLLVKQFKEEEDKKIIFILDVGDNMVFGSTPKLKCEIAAEIVLSLANIVINTNGRVGAILFAERIKNYLIPKRGTRTFDIFVDVLSDSIHYGGGSDMSNAMEFALQNFDTSVSSIVLVSDFVNFNKKDAQNLVLLAGKFETVAFMVKDPIDKVLPDIDGEFVVENPFTKEQILIEPKLAKKKYEKYSLDQEKFVKENLKNNGVDCLEISTGKPFIFDLIEFMSQRVKKGVYV